MIEGLIFLSIEERERFAEYCRRLAASNRLIEEQMRLVQVPEFLLNKYIQESKALDVVAGILSSTVQDSY